MAIKSIHMKYRFSGCIRKLFPFFPTFVLIVLGSVDTPAQDTFQLAPPYLRYTSIFFEKEALVEIAFAQDGSQIHYTTNGQTPTLKDPVYTHPIRLKNNFTTLKAKVFDDGFVPSDIVEATFFKKGYKVDQITTTAPNVRYPGSGRSTLTDGIAGVDSYGSTNWMGFQRDTVVVQLTLTRAQKIKQVLLHVLQNQGAWIFLPQKVEVFKVDEDTDEWISIGSQLIPARDKVDQNISRALLIDLPNRVKTDKIILKIFPLTKIPAWHPGKDTPAWLFIDEVKLY